jgi:exoribonuclease R
MRQCELERVAHEKGNFLLKRTGEKKIAYVEGVTPEMAGVIIDLKKVEGLWVVDKVHEPEIEKYQIKRTWHVGGL